MWTCGKCGEKIDEEFEVCWSCGTSVEGVEDPSFLHEVAEDVLPVTGEESAGIDRSAEKLVTVAVFNLPGDAQMARFRLEAAGIPVMAEHEFTVMTFWFNPNSQEGIQLKVRESDVNRAREVLGGQT